MRMCYLKWWQRIEYVFLVALGLGAFYLDRNAFFIAFLTIVTLISVGFFSRKAILKKIELDATRIGLKRIGLLRARETKDKIWYEIHVLFPDRDGSITEGIQIKIVREFIRDIPKLYEYAKLHGKDVIYFGTSHHTFNKAWIDGWAKLGITNHQVKNAKSIYSSSQWKGVMRQIYGKKIMDRPNEWKKIITTIRKEDMYGYQRVSRRRASRRGNSLKTENNSTKGSTARSG